MVTLVAAATVGSWQCFLVTTFIIALTRHFCVAPQMRHEIDLLLLELWQDERCRSCIKQQASAGGDVFPDFVSAVLNDLMYLFKDSLERLYDIKQIEDSKKDVKVCNASTLCAYGTCW